MDQKSDSDFLEDEITAIVEETETRQHILFRGLNSRLTSVVTAAHCSSQVKSRLCLEMRSFPG